MTRFFPVRAGVRASGAKQSRWNNAALTNTVDRGPLCGPRGRYRPNFGVISRGTQHDQHQSLSGAWRPLVPFGGAAESAASHSS